MKLKHLPNQLLTNCKIELYVMPLITDNGLEKSGGTCFVQLGQLSLIICFICCFKGSDNAGDSLMEVSAVLVQNVSLLKKIDYTLNSELKKLQFFGAGPKTALPETLVGDTGQSRRCHQFLTVSGRLIC